MEKCVMRRAIVLAVHPRKEETVARANKRIGVLWLKESKEGRKYMSGYIDNGIHGDIPVAIFRATTKLTETSPDYVMVLSEQRPKPAPEVNGEEQAPIVDDEEVPF
jgi:hypothetical protein